MAATAPRNRRRGRPPNRTASHRPASQPRRFRHDKLTAVDLFSGFGGLTEAIKKAGFDVISAANHNEYKVDVHEKNHPDVEHWIADLVDEEASDYHSAADLPRADLLVAGISCTSFSQANTERAYALGLTLFELDEDPDYEARVTKSERDRATALCVLQYAAKHHPRMILLECTTEFQSWGPAIPGKPKIGDGSTYRWFLGQLDKENYGYQVLFLNSQFFGVPQSRDRWFLVAWDKSIPAPDLEHRPMTWCSRCDETLPAVWTWKTGIPISGSVRYGKQYHYTCPRCRGAVVPPMAPSIHALDLTNLGTRIGDKPHKDFFDKAGRFIGRGPMAPATMARAGRCKDRFGEFPAVLMPAKAVYGVEKHLWQPMATQTTQQSTALLSTGHVIAAHKHNGDGRHISQPMDTVTTTHEKALLLAIDNFQGGPRGAHEPLPTQVGSETLGIVSAGVLPFRKNTVPPTHGEPMPTMTSDQVPGLITAAGLIKNNGPIGEASYRAHPVTNPLGALVASASNQALLTSGWAQMAAEWRDTLSRISLNDCFFRMLGKHEVGRGCGFDVDFPGYKGTFIVWGSARDQIDGFGNAVSPAVGEWIGLRLRAVLDRCYSSPWGTV